jgi:hypothetical protein
MATVDFYVPPIEGDPMKRFTLSFDCSNAAFGDDDTELCEEVSRILTMAAINARDGRLYQPLYDANGNMVGKAEIIRIEEG